MQSKQEIRKKIAVRRKALDSQWVEAASDQIVRRLEALEAFQAAKTVGLYMAISGEVNLDPLLLTCRASGQRICIPLFNPSAGIYEMTEIRSEDDCRTGHYGIREPCSPVPVPVQQIDLMAVPGVAFDRKGNRLGRGGGYYDRLLAGFPGVTAAVAFDFQVFSAIPTDPHDRQADLLVTETRLINVLNEH